MNKMIKRDMFEVRGILTSDAHRAKSRKTKLGDVKLGNKNTIKKDKASLIIIRSLCIRVRTKELFISRFVAGFRLTKQTKYY